MKAALIPPAGYERTALTSDIHLMLPLAETMKNQIYVQTYGVARDRGDYIILDNGVAEGQLVATRGIVNVARVFKVDEVVAPDVMDDMEGTITLTRAFLEETESSLEGYAIMGVLQGKTDSQLLQLMDFFAAQERIKVIGIPKVHLREPGSITRSWIAKWIQEHWSDRFQVHLLGAHKNNIWELKELDFPSNVRSTDSTLPYKLASEEYTLDFPAYVPRWSDYFSTPKAINMKVLQHNIDLYMEWAGRSGLQG